MRPLYVIYSDSADLSDTFDALADTRPCEQTKTQHHLEYVLSPNADTPAVPRQQREWEINLSKHVRHQD